MVIVDFVFMARTQFVQSIQFPQASDWHINIKCSHCHQDFPKEVTVNKSQTVQMPKQHGLAHFGATCKNCERKGFITIDPKSTYIVKPNEDGIIKETIATFECRGIQIVSVNLGDSMSVKIANSPTVIQNADFTDLWCQVDQITQNLAQVQDPKIQVAVHK